MTRLLIVRLLFVICGIHCNIDANEGKYKEMSHQRVKRSLTISVGPSDQFKNFMVRPYRWPLLQSNVYENWNKMPSTRRVDPFHNNVKYIHRSFEELPSYDPGLPDPLAVTGQLFQLGDSLVPRIRFRIPFFEYMKKSFLKVSKPKVVYMKEPPIIKYVGVPVIDEDDYLPMSEFGHNTIY